MFINGYPFEVAPFKAASFQRSMRSVLECGAFCTLRKEVITMDCPYIIRETIDADHVREHGYYQLNELAYDLTHDFAGADVEVISRPVYNVVMESGERLSNVDDETVFKMLSAGLPVLHVENARDGYIMYSRHKPTPPSQDELLSRYKVAYLINKVVSSEETEEHLKIATKIGLEGGLTDINFFFAETACNDILPRVKKLYNRGLYGLRNIEEEARAV